MNQEDSTSLVETHGTSPSASAFFSATYVSDAIGKFYVEDKAVPVAISFEDSSPTVPMFFILSPGVDPVGFVVALGKTSSSAKSAE